MAENPTSGAATVPPTPLIYLDVDDEITSAAARIRAAEAEQVALVLPYGSRLATSRINFRLLAREAAERGKKIEIVCADSSARALAAAAGLPVHPSVAAFEGHRTGVNSETAPHEAGAGEHTGAGGGNGTDATTLNAHAIAGPGAAGVPVGGLSIEDDTQTRVITLPRRSSPRVPLVGPPRPPVRTGLAVGVGLAAVVLVLAGGILALELLPSATIVLHPRSEEIGPVELIINARPDVTAADPETLTIPAGRVTFALEATHTITATGVKVVDSKATGNVTFSNFDTGGGVVIPTGTIVRTESKIEFRTLAEVTLPSARFDFFPPFAVHPSTSSVGVEAVVAGESGNVGNNAINDVPKARRTLTVTNPEATAGGAHTETPEVSQADVDAALLALEDGLAADLGRQVTEGVGVAPEVDVIAESQVVGLSDYSVDPATLVGSPELEVQLTATAEGSVLTVDPGPIQSIAEARLQSRVTEGWGLAPGSVSYEPGTPTLLGEVISYPVSIRATQVRVVDEATLVGAVRGLIIPEARSRLDDFGDTEITVWPDWVTTIPSNAERITLTLAEPRPAPSPSP